MQDWTPHQNPPDDIVYMCMWDEVHGLHCNDLICGSDFSVHLRDAHGVHGADKLRVCCRWDGCSLQLNKESLLRHVEEKHLRIAYHCGTCGRSFQRRDTLNKHKRICSGLSIEPRHPASKDVVPGS